MAIILNDYDFVALEINGSCPNDGISLFEKGSLALRSAVAVKEVTRFPLVFKWSPAQEEVARATASEMADIVSAFSINSVPWRMIFPDKKSPLAHLGGGAVSGKAAQKFTWPMARMLKNVSDVPVIWPSMWDYEDILKAFRMGADAVSFAGLSLRHPTKPTKYVRRRMAEIGAFA